MSQSTAFTVRTLLIFPESLNSSQITALSASNSVYWENFMGKNLKHIKCNLSRTFNTWCCDTKDKVVTLHVDDSGIDSCWRKFFSLFFSLFCFVLFCFFFYNILLIITYNLFILLPHQSSVCISSTCSTLQYCYCTLWEF